MSREGGDAAPAANPCGSCPYRRDVPSGVWSADEYEKLPAYDNETPYQPPAAFFCHQQDGRLCAGWVGCHDMPNSLGLRLAALFGVIDRPAYQAACDYSTEVPLWESGAAAAEHGLVDLDAPSERAIVVATRLALKRSQRGSR